MEWEKAKQVFIYILIAINIVLFAFNYKNSRKYTITAAQEKAVYTLLSNNGIGLYTELISDYEPMRQIAVTSKIIGDDDIRKSFFQADENAIGKILSTPTPLATLRTVKVLVAAEAPRS